MKKLTTAEKLRKAVRDSGERVATIAIAAGIAQPVLHRFVKGERDMTLRTAEKLFKYFNLELRSMTKKSHLYTRVGDKGNTFLAYGKKVIKSDLRIRALGAIDELNAAIGINAIDHNEAEKRFLQGIQGNLMAIGAELSQYRKSSIKPEKVKEIETKIDELDAECEPLRNFILPGGSPMSASYHVVRGVCRRTEREVIALHECIRHEPYEQQIDANTLEYLNRLSDLFFVLARWHNDKGKADIIWKSP